MHQTESIISTLLTQVIYQNNAYLFTFLIRNGVIIATQFGPIKTNPYLHFLN
jgi:hypothetical protein